MSRQSKKSYFKRRQIWRTKYEAERDARADFEKAEPDTEQKILAREKWLATKKDLREFEKRVGIRGRSR